MKAISRLKLVLTYAIKTGGIVGAVSAFFSDLLLPISNIGLYLFLFFTILFLLLLLCYAFFNNRITSFIQQNDTNLDGIWFMPIATTLLFISTITLAAYIVGNQPENKDKGYLATNISFFEDIQRHTGILESIEENTAAILVEQQKTNITVSEINTKTDSLVENTSSSAKSLEDITQQISEQSYSAVNFLEAIKLADVSRISAYISSPKWNQALYGEAAKLNEDTEPVITLMQNNDNERGLEVLKLLIEANLIDSRVRINAGTLFGQALFDEELHPMIEEKLHIIRQEQRVIDNEISQLLKEASETLLTTEHIVDLYKEYKVCKETNNTYDEKLCRSLKKENKGLEFTAPKTVWAKEYIELEDKYDILDEQQSQLNSYSKADFSDAELSLLYVAKSNNNKTLIAYLENQPLPSDGNALVLAKKQKRVFQIDHNGSILFEQIKTKSEKQNNINSPEEYFISKLSGSKCSLLSGTSKGRIPNADIEEMFSCLVVGRPGLRPSAKTGRANIHDIFSSEVLDLIKKQDNERGLVMLQLLQIEGDRKSVV